MPLTYLEMRGAGNRILIVDQRVGGMLPPDADTLRRLADPDSGPGFDQLMWLAPADDASFDLSYRVFNADGSEVEQCGNGVRCVAWMLAQNSGDRTVFRLQGPARAVTARIVSDGLVAVDMGVPLFEPDAIPFAAGHKAGRYELEVAGESFDVAVLSMGNPHCILDVADVAAADVERLGPLIESHPRFPARTNVGFMRIRDRGSIDLRVYERGAGETLACGTGACAAVVAGRGDGRLDGEVVVNLPGGQLVVSWRGGSEPVWLSGLAEIINEGMIDL